MGQAFRRVAGRVRSSGLDNSTSSSFSRRPPPPPPAGGAMDRVDIFRKPDGDGNSGGKRGSGLEERDLKFDEMLNQMVGRITSKPGGRSEMGQASVVEKYNRPLPKLRNTKSDSGRYEDRAAPPGTLNVAQLRHVMLLHEGKSDDHNGPMNTKDIAEIFRLDVSQLEKILQFVSLPAEDAVRTKQNDDQF